MTEANPSATQGPTHVTTLERRWVFKMIVMIIVLVGFAAWAYYDATIAYPARGAKVANADLRELLRIAADEGKSNQVSTPEPAAELRRFAEKNPSSTFEQAKLQWLTSLSLIGKVSPEHTTITDPVGKKTELDALAAQSPNDKPNRLSPWDIPAQWAILAVCGAIALWLIVLYLRVAATKYQWNEHTKTLYLPGGHSLVPTDIIDFDKRKWHKFLIYLGIRPEHATLGGKTVKLDLYRHSHLESWVLEMERIVKPESADNADQGDPPPAAPTSEVAA